MLTSIQIRNYVLIENLDISFRPGFSVMTGQTGAGKSIILGAMNLLMGQRAESRVISDNAEKCTIEGHFNVTGYGIESLFEDNSLDYDGNDTILRREVRKDGKSRAFINDTPVSLTVLKQIGSHLIDIHSQHQNLLLGTEEFQMSVLDTMAGNTLLLESYRNAFGRYRKCTTRLEKLREEADDNIRQQEYLQFQYDELDKARLEEGEQESLESEQDILSHAEEIKEALFRAGNFMSDDSSGAVQAVRAAIQSLRSAGRNLPAADALSQRLESCLIELRDIDAETAGLNDDTTFDPQRLECVNERLDLLYSLQKKHRCNSEEELIAYRDSLRSRLEMSGSCGEEISRLEKEAAKLQSECAELAAQLTDTRRKAAVTTESEICRMLIPLGIKGARFNVRITPKDSPDMNGTDGICFMFSANSGVALQELSSVASGGELSRVMLSIKTLLAGAIGLPTLIFDEIDTGVSGAVAEQMALMMRGMCAEGRQVIAISHLPQIAAKSDAHYLVYKEEGDDDTHTHITELSKEQRITEIARMMSGATITEAAMSNARELMDN